MKFKSMPASDDPKHPQPVLISAFEYNWIGECHAAIKAGRDLSQPQTLRGHELPRLPGMTPGYFIGKAQNLGAIEPKP